MLCGRIAALLYKQATRLPGAGPAGSTRSRLEGRVARRARVGTDITNIAQPGHVAEQALKAQPATGMRHGAVAAQVPVTTDGGLILPVPGHAVAHPITPIP